MSAGIIEQHDMGTVSNNLSTNDKNHHIITELFELEETFKGHLGQATSTDT